MNYFTKTTALSGLKLSLLTAALLSNWGAMAQNAPNELPTSAAPKSHLPKDEVQNSDAQKFPLQHQSWGATIEQAEREDVLEKNPRNVILWAGSSYAKEYHSPRGHQFAVADVSHTLRTGVAPKAGEKGLSASCWTCKSPDAPRLIGELGFEGYAAKNFTDLGAEMKSVVYCSDCHESGSAKLTLPRPHAKDAMAKIHLPFEQQNATMQSAQVCGQCHVTYYFRPEKSNVVNIPWIFGNTADEIEKYYDTRRFYEWVHPLSKAPMLKARHPEFEHWSRSKHAEVGVTCVTCHMPSAQDKKGNEFTNHKVDKALPNFETSCKGCHSSKDKLETKLTDLKTEIDNKAHAVEDLLVKAHYEAKAAWVAGATWEQMNDPIMDIRHSQWRWDFAMSSHGLYAHNPKEGRQLLDTALEQAKSARTSLAEVLKQLNSEVYYPDISTKAKAQEAIGLNEAELIKEKQQFIKEEIDKNWDPVAHRGY
ncbi:cytochrome c552 [Shewanella sp. ANA-3]|uniref:ammonia-forming cytochrome c nitrite reductase subunit c552 n=1 Tax=Shewanella sp. (strain ANA-3) TaxID=94122 RepID=UPI0000E69FBC|nr:ammonia-forming cytochrome c nitrite reductase subunit c552 [Shewanella sp. ANA-3]ABK48592.1 cytochrome c552 [Shewanella sp. ANA-3]